jgi:hypothetical protein
MSVYNDLQAYTVGILGQRVDRATAVPPATTNTAYFTIAGGRVAITLITGKVTTIIQAQANAMKFTLTPTTGTAADICTTLDINADEAGTLYSVTGVVGAAMLGVSAGGTMSASNHIIADIGTLDLDCAATNTGSIKWTVFYIPIDNGATVVVA